MTLFFPNCRVCGATGDGVAGSGGGPQRDGLARLSDEGLLRLHAEVLAELRRRGSVKTFNNPVGDLAERLVTQCFNLKLQSNSAAGYDAFGADGCRYQIKARRLTPGNGSRQLSAIRNLQGQEFDDLVAVLFTEDYRVAEAYIIPFDVVVKHARFRPHTNSFRLIARGHVLLAPGVRVVTEELRAIQVANAAGRVNY